MSLAAALARQWLPVERHPFVSSSRDGDGGGGDDGFRGGDGSPHGAKHVLRGVFFVVVRHLESTAAACAAATCYHPGVAHEHASGGGGAGVDGSSSSFSSSSSCQTRRAPATPDYFLLRPPPERRVCPRPSRPYLYGWDAQLVKEARPCFVCALEPKCCYPFSLASETT